MKNFIFVILSFLLMSMVSLEAQASSVTANISCKSELSVVDVGLPDIQWFALKTVPTYCFTQNIPTVSLIANNPAMVCSMKNETAILYEQILMPKYKFRYIYKSNTTLSKLIIPYYDDCKRLHITKVPDLRHKLVGG